MRTFIHKHIRPPRYYPKDLCPPSPLPSPSENIHGDWNDGQTFDLILQRAETALILGVPFPGLWVVRRQITLLYVVEAFCFDAYLPTIP